MDSKRLILNQLPDKVIIQVKILHTCVESWILAEESGTKVITTNGWSVWNGEAELFEKIDNPNCFSSSIGNGFVLIFSG